jgi:molecular chaperone GrpE (heat shock protein)
VESQTAGGNVSSLPVTEPVSPAPTVTIESGDLPSDAQFAQPPAETDAARPSAKTPPPVLVVPPNVDPGNVDKAAATLLQAKNESVIEYLGRFEAQLTDHLCSTASCSRSAFDRLYDEMQAYKRNFLLEAQRPLLLDLMMLYDSIDKLRRNYDQASTVDPAVLSQNLDSLQVEAEEILLRVGIERMTATPDTLDVNLQKTVKTISTGNPDEHLAVVEHVRSGFLSGGKPLRKEQVIIKTYIPGA